VHQTNFLDQENTTTTATICCKKSCHHHNIIGTSNRSDLPSPPQFYINLTNKWLVQATVLKTQPNLRMFGSVVVVAFQSAFHSEKYVNNIFLFFKNHFWDQHIKMIWKHQKHITSKKKKKNSNFLKSAFQQQCQTPSNRLIRSFSDLGINQVGF
jgi:hypothetical protein